MATLTPTKEQQAVLDAMRGYFEAKCGPDGYTKIFALFLSAVAGAGKTSTIMMIADVVAEVERTTCGTLEWTALSFNKAIMRASNKKLKERGAREVAKTTNALGRAILVAAAEAGKCRKPGKLDTYKYSDIITKYCKKNARQIPELPYNDPRRETEKTLNAKIRKLVSAARLTFIDASDEEALINIVEHYDTGIDLLSPYWKFISRAVAPVIADGIEDYNATGKHDFDDQIFLPLALDVAAPIFDLICTDEAQDLNKVRTELVKRSIKPNGALFFVGDRRQAIQGFAFADTESVDNIIRDTNAIELPLTCCWRCDLNIIRLAQVINPSIQARPNAGAGTVEVISRDYVDRIEPGYYSKGAALNRDADMVLCRTTAPLVKGCLQAIRIGKLAIVRGRSIGDNIIRLLDKILAAKGVYDITKLAAAARAYYSDEAVKIINSGAKDAEEQIDKLSDQIDTLEALVAGYLLTEPEEMTINNLKDFISSKFEGEEGEDEEEQKEGPRPVIFSTVHKAKGLETDRVFILEPGLMPHPMAMKQGRAWQIEQEYNILYVAVTRAKHELYFVGGIPASLQMEYEAMTAGELDAAAAIAEAVEIINGSAAPVVEIEAVQEEKPAAKRGRKSLDDSDKKIKLEAFLDPSIRRALKHFAGLINEDTKQNMSEAEVVELLIMTNPAFAAFFDGPEAPEYKEEWSDRQRRYEANREAYKHRNRSKKAGQ